MSVNGEFGQTGGASFRRLVLRKIQFVPESDLFPTALSRPVDWRLIQLKPGCFVLVVFRFAWGRLQSIKALSKVQQKVITQMLDALIAQAATKTSDEEKEV
ncbi:hypothetical protein AK821_00550 [Pseudomonas sp. RIT-PI-r]|nr:hypothetical protein AK821_00550 [Pseudomonas sp. RIT-PI-r]